MRDPNEEPKAVRDPTDAQKEWADEEADEPSEDADGQSSRPAAWPGIPGPEEEHLGSLATHPETKDPPARLTQTQRDLERDEHRDLEQWEADQREADELR